MDFQFAVHLFSKDSMFMETRFKLILSCQNLQSDGTCMFKLEAFIPKLCQLAQETGESEREKNLCAAGLQALASMVYIHMATFLLKCMIMSTFSWVSEK